MKLIRIITKNMDFYLETSTSGHHKMCASYMKLVRTKLLRNYEERYVDQVKNLQELSECVETQKLSENFGKFVIVLTHLDTTTSGSSIKKEFTKRVRAALPTQNLFTCQRHQWRHVNTGIN